MKLAEYIWVDGTFPTPLLRSKTKVLQDNQNPPMWGFDGSSTNQAQGNKSDCVLRPCFVTPDTIRGGDNILVLCEVFGADGKPHETNTRNACRSLTKKYAEDECWFGLEQEYTLMRDKKPLGFPEEGEPPPQGDYYCGVGNSRAFGRRIAEAHLQACLNAGLTISGINAEVCPGQWEFQVGPIGPLEASDNLWIARYLLERISESYGVTVSWDPKPMEGDWNGAGCHANFSTNLMRENYAACIKAAELLGENAAKHIKNYGSGIERRLTGEHETCAHTDFKWGVSDRTASIRIPWQVEKNQGGYIEDRRPNSNCDPYVVTALIVEAVCPNLKKK